MSNYANKANAENQGDMQSEDDYDDAGESNNGAHGGDFLNHPDDAELGDDVDAGQDELVVGDDGEAGGSGDGINDDDDGEFLLENEPHLNSTTRTIAGNGGGQQQTASASSSKLPSTTALNNSAKQQSQFGGDLQQRKAVINNNLIPSGGMPTNSSLHTSQSVAENENYIGSGADAAAGGEVSASMFEQQQQQPQAGGGAEEDDPNQYGEQELLDYDEEEDENAEYAAAAGGDGEALADMRSRIREMEEEADKLREMQTVADKRLSSNKPPADPAAMFVDDKVEVDARSVYVGNVDYGATAEELEKHFHACGSVVRVTILCDKFTGYPKGFAYIEFGEKEAVDTALALDESMFRGRQIKVSSKRTNQPGISTSDRGRGRGGPPGRGGRAMRRPFRGGGFGGGGPTFASRSRGGFGHGFNPYGRPRGRRPTRFFYRGAV